jgi:hypothetical protein
MQQLREILFIDPSRDFPDLSPRLRQSPREKKTPRRTELKPLAAKRFNSQPRGFKTHSKIEQSNDTIQRPTLLSGKDEMPPI